MPLFGNKFSPKKSGPRKFPSMSNLNLDASKETLEGGPIKIKLGTQEIMFSDGEWITASGGGGANPKEVTQLKKHIQKLEEENNLMRFKMELLLDMLSERTAEVHLQENEIEQLKKQFKRR